MLWGPSTNLFDWWLRCLDTRTFRRNVWQPKTGFPLALKTRGVVWCTLHFVVTDMKMRLSKLAGFDVIEGSGVP